MRTYVDGSAGRRFPARKCPPHAALPDRLEASFGISYQRRRLVCSPGLDRVIAMSVLGTLKRLGPTQLSVWTPELVFVRPSSSSSTLLLPRRKFLECRHISGILLHIASPKNCLGSNAPAEKDGDRSEVGWREARVLDELLTLRWVCIVSRLSIWDEVIPRWRAILQTRCHHVATERFTFFRHSSMFQN